MEDNEVTVKIVGYDSQGFPVIISDTQECGNETLLLTFVRDQAVKFCKDKFNGR